MIRFPRLTPQDASDLLLYRMPRRTKRDWGLLALLLAASAVVFLVNLTVSGYANEFYSAAAQAGSMNWTAFLFGSLDPGNAITVDKPPASIWVMALSVRIFGLSSLSILLPQALMGIATTWLIYATVRRHWGNATGLGAGLVFILTPVAALMFRFNNPDALLVLLMTGASYAVLRSLEYRPTRRGSRRRTWWMVLAGVLIGFGFLTKQLQVLLVLPGFAMAFLMASPTRIPRRIGDGLAAVAAMVVSAGWWVLLTVLVPASDRPYIGGSQNDSFLELTFGYNGFGRLTGDEEGSVVGGTGTGGGMWGSTGWTRLFDGEYGTQIAWLAPLAFAGIVLGLVAVGRAARTDLRRAGIVVWGGWLTVTWIVFSFMAGIFHQYYTVALSPAVAVLAAVACAALWSCRRRTWAKITAPILVAVSTLWSASLIGRADWVPWLRWAVIIVGLAGVITLAAAGVLSSSSAAVAQSTSAESTGDEDHADDPDDELQGGFPADVPADASATDSLPAMSPVTAPTALMMTPVPSAANLLAKIGATLSVMALLAGPAAWTGYTVSTSHTGSIVLAGPSVTSSSSRSFGGGRANFGGGQGGGMRMPGGTGGFGGGGTGQGGGFGGTTGGMSGFLGSGSTSSTITTMLESSAGSYRWAAATTGSQTAAKYQLASGRAVMAIGGFNGSDPSPTLAQFKKYVRQGLIHYYIAGSIGGTQLGGSDTASQISSWVEENFTAQTIDGVTIYNLTERK